MTAEGRATATVTTATPDRAERTRRGPSWFTALRDALDRPLTSYYLLLGASAMLLTVGLIMVLSASSV
jgi:cell division protein FtsW